jgi:hypothetical protein
VRTALANSSDVFFYAIGGVRAGYR